jgi:vacuolar-type H+-ATPase subunit H
MTTENTLRASVLRPGLLVSLKTSVRGGVNYHRVELEPERMTADGKLYARWETSREIPDPDEFERAVQVRSKCRSLITSACYPSSFGLLCPDADEQKLRDAVAEARRIAQEHNDAAKRTRVDVYILIGRVARNDEEAARAIAGEVRELIEAMKAGIAAADPKAIRDAANKARDLGAMLTDDAAGKVQEAIDQARKAAREIVKRVEKAGEQAATVLAEIAVDKLDGGRFAFLDMDGERPVTQEAPAARGIDLEPANDEQAAAQPINSGRLPFDLEVA